jgi:flagellar hook-associated protein 3 FlgL
MTMRVPNLMNNAQSMLDLQRIKQQYSNTVLQLTTGKAIVNLGDDPTSATEISNYQSSVDLNAQYIAQANTASTQMTNTSTILSSILSDVQSVVTQAQQGLASTDTPAGMTAGATEVDSLRTDLISLGNSQAQGQYLFAGTDTTTEPFLDNVPATGTTPQSVTYAGNSGLNQLTVGTSTTVTTNIPGNSLFFGPGGQGSSTDLLAQVTAARDALTSGNTAALQTAYTNLQAIATRIDTVQTDMGGRENGASVLQNGLSDFNANLSAQQSQIESVDYPTAITQLNEESVAQQAALNAMSMSNSKTLFDYIA